MGQGLVTPRPGALAQCDRDARRARRPRAVGVLDMAVRQGLDNTPKATELANIRNILAPGLQQVRDILGLPVQITATARRR